MENEKKQHNDSRFWTGLFFLGAGSVLLANKLGFPIPYWMMTWQFFLIALGMFIGFKHNFRHFGWLVLVAIGTFFLIEQEIPQLGLHEYFWPVIIIGVGLLFMLKPKRYRGHWDRDRWRGRMRNRYQWQDSANTFVGSEHTSESNDDSFDIKSVFSGVQRRILSKDFKGGRISCVFGGAEIDFMQADINGTVELRIDEVFGGIKLIIPQSWTVKNEIDGVFHGVEDKRNSYTKSTTTDTNKVLILSGSAVFAGIDIRSY